MMFYIIIKATLHPSIFWYMYNVTLLSLGLQTGSKRSNLKSCCTLTQKSHLAYVLKLNRIFVIFFVLFSISCTVYSVFWNECWKTIFIFETKTLYEISQFYTLYWLRAFLKSWLSTLTYYMYFFVLPTAKRISKNINSLWD